MDSTPSSRQVDSVAHARRWQGAGAVGAYLEFVKARLCALVLVTTLAGYLLASQGPVGGAKLLWTMIGTALAAFGANALNQWAEVRRDERMERTRRRPLPAGRLDPRQALLVAVGLSVGGPIVLGWGVNLLSAGLALLTSVLYVGVYTPLKTRTPLNTLVGAVVGAIPPMIGWVGAAGRLDTGAWILGAILFLWQIPHFLALAWMYREDYERGGFRMLPTVDPAGQLTGYVMVLYTLLLLPIGLLATLEGIAGWWYAGGSVLLGAWFTALVLHLYATRSRAAARRVFLASAMYLPLLLGLMVIDRAPARGTPYGDTEAKRQLVEGIPGDAGRRVAVPGALGTSLRDADSAVGKE